MQTVRTERSNDIDIRSQSDSGEAALKQSKKLALEMIREKGVLAGLNLREVASGAGVNRISTTTSARERSIVNSTPSIMSRSDEIISLLALSNVALRTFYGTAVPRPMTASCARCW